MIKEDGACGVQGECEGTRFVHPGKGWIQGGSSCTFCHCLSKKDEEKMHTQKYTEKEENRSCNDGNC